MQYTAFGSLWAQRWCNYSFIDGRFFIQIGLRGWILEGVYSFIGDSAELLYYKLVSGQKQRAC